MNKVLVILEHIDGELKKQSKEALTAGKKIADSFSGGMDAVALGAGSAGLGDEAGKFGAGSLYSVDTESTKNYSPDLWAKVVKNLIEEKGYEIILAAATSFGKDFVPHVSALFGKATAQDSIKLDVDGGKLKITRPMYAGKAWALTYFEDAPEFVTLRPNSVAAEEFGGTAEVENYTNGADAQPLSVVSEIIKSASKKLDVAEADIIVSGGRGMGGPENWPLIEELADLLGAANGASRAAVDAGWRPHSEQVGQTGKTVSPQLYIACGISGAIQHLAGMSSSKYIVAINKDPEAPIFKVADYGIVGDLFDVVPRMVEELKKG